MDVADHTERISTDVVRVDELPRADACLSQEDEKVTKDFMELFHAKYEPGIPLGDSRAVPGIHAFNTDDHHCYQHSQSQDMVDSCVHLEVHFFYPHHSKDNSN